MGEIKVRRLDARVLAALKGRAKRRGVSLESEVRRILGEAVAAKRATFARRAAAMREATRLPKGRTPSDSAELIREERDAWG
jgi:plasmid stability protein